MLFVVLFLILFGLAIGSFLHVLIYRTVHDESYVTGRSKCPHCKKHIRWYDNVPVVSFFLLGGKCRNCKKPISWDYPAIEMMTAGLFVWWYLIGFTFFRLSTQPFSLLQPAFWLFVGVCLITIFFADLLYGVIPDSIVIVLTGLGLLYRIMLYVFHVMRPDDFWLTLVGATISVLAFLGLWIGTKKRGMGLGDVKFVFPLGLILGWPNMAVGLFLSFVIGAIVGVGLIISKQKKFRQTVPFGPFLVVGSAITLVFGDQMLRWYLSLL